MVKKLYPEVEITYADPPPGGAVAAPPRGGRSARLINNAGAGNLDNSALVAEGQLEDLADLLAAPSYDTEWKTVGETLVPRSQESGIFDGVQYLLNWALSPYGIWYSATYMEEHGYEYPETWDDIRGLWEEINDAAWRPGDDRRQLPQYAPFILDPML